MDDWRESDEKEEKLASISDSQSPRIKMYVIIEAEC